MRREERDPSVLIAKAIGQITGSFLVGWAVHAILSDLGVPLPQSWCSVLEVGILIYFFQHFSKRDSTP